MNNIRLEVWLSVYLSLLQIAESSGIKDESLLMSVTPTGLVLYKY